MCRKDARTCVGEYIRLAWDVTNDNSITVERIAERIKKISDGKEHSIDWAITQLENENCYEGWEDELRYLLFRYEEHLSEQRGQQFSNEQWSRIWEDSAASSIEHICPQSKGSIERIEPGKEGIFVHRIGNLVILPPGLNSKLQDKLPINKADDYISTGLVCATEVANTIKSEGWSEQQIISRETKIIDWIKFTWA
mgnify:CR=1 FL=1